MAVRKSGNKKNRIVDNFRHVDESRKNIPTAEYEPLVEGDMRSPIQVAYDRRNRDLDPQLVWRGKDDQDASDLYVPAPPVYIQEKIQPKVLIDDLVKFSGKEDTQAVQADMFSDFNGIPEGADKTEFYQHDFNWTNRMVLGDSLQVMASMSEREGLRGKVQCIYMDPPYGIKFNSNFQWSTTSRDVTDGKPDHITREPEQVKAFRDTWRDEIHSYLGYIRDRLTVARDLLADSGSIFVQIGEENVHRVRMVLDEIFGESNFVSEIVVVKTSGMGTNRLPRQNDFVLFYAKSIEQHKYRQLFMEKELGGQGASGYRYLKTPDCQIRSMTVEERSDPTSIPKDCQPLTFGDLTKPGPGSKYSVNIQGKTYTSRGRWWGMPKESLERANRADRIYATDSSISYQRQLNDWTAFPLTNIWTDTGSGGSGDKIFIVQTNPKIVERCILMATDPGDLVLDPTCGSGTTSYVAEQWGRRWITIDTSRVALALARARIMGARYPYYLLSDSRDGQTKEAEVRRSVPSESATYGNIRAGFVYHRIPHITLRDIVRNSEIDVIWDHYQNLMEPIRGKLNNAISEIWEEWEIPRESDPSWSAEVKKLHVEWWDHRIKRQKEIDDSISAKTESEYLYDKPYEDTRKVRVAGPFTVESISPFRSVDLDEEDEIINHGNRENRTGSEHRNFAENILENLRTAGVQQAHKEDRIDFTTLVPWPGDLVCAEGRFVESQKDDARERRAAVFIGSEFGTVSRADLVGAAREAADSGFDVLVACAFNYEAHATEFDKLGSIPVLKARMNADLHMANELKNTGSGNLFVIFGEPDIDVLDNPNGQIKVRLNGVDVFHPSSGKVISDNADGIACWFVDTDYDNESFFVRQAYFLGAKNQYKALKTTLKAEINEEAWATLHSNESRPFDKPDLGRIAVKVINSLGDEVMKVFKV